MTDTRSKIKLLIPLEELKDLKSRDPVKLECNICKSEFHQPKNLVLRGLRGTRQVCTCSKECWKEQLQESNRKSPKMIELKCEWCSKIFKRINKQYRKVNVKMNKKCFCSISCASSHQSKYLIKTRLRSTLEIWLEKKLRELYPNLEIIPNDRRTLGKEIDLYIPSLKLAIEINGIYHYEPIYGTDRLQSVQERDKIKSKDCADKGISLLVINAKDFSRLSEKRDKKYLDVIVEVINENIKVNQANSVSPSASRWVTL